MRNLGALVAILLVQACTSAHPGSGGGDDVGPDAATTADAAPPDGPQVGAVDVIVAGWPGLAQPPALYANVPVVFFKPDGSLGSVVMTDANGHASATIERGSLVAAVYGANRADVQVDGAIASPGDTLRFGPDIHAGGAAGGTLHVSWPTRTVTGYTVYYTVLTPCGSVGETTSTSATIALDQSCASTPFDVVVTSRRSSQETTGIMSRRAVQPGANITVNLADNQAAWNIGGFMNLTVSGVPANASGSCGGVQRLGTMAINGTGSSVFMGGCSMRLLPGTETTWDLDASYSLDANPQFAVGVTQTMPHDTLAPIDLSGALPMIASLAYAPATRELSWSSAQPVTFDASSVRLTVSARNLIWRLYAPNGLPVSFHVPALPATLAAYDLQASDVTRVELENFDVAGATPAELMQHNLYYDEAAFAGHARRAATARVP